MAYIRCPKCSQRISNQSIRCIYCQRPIKGHVTEDGRPKKIVKKSSKGWMLLFSLATVLLFVAGTFLFIRDQGNGLRPYESPIALGLMTLGLAGYVFLRVLSWVERFK